MDQKTRRIEQSPLYQGVNEQIAYTLTTTPWGSSPSSQVVTILDKDGVDVTSDVTTGSASVAGDVITTQTVDSLTVGAQYLIQIRFTVDGNVVETFADLFGQA